MGFGIWHYLSGYVIIDIKGRGLERFVNRVVQSGGDIWSVKRTGTNSLRASVSVGTFYSLRPIVRQCGVSISIAEKRGLIISLSNMRGRKVLLYGWLAVVALVLSASRYIWFVDVEGCDMVDPQAVIASLGDMGVMVGSNKRAVSTYKLGSALMATDARIAWAGVKISGVVLKVEIVEANKAQAQSNADKPQSLFAAKDGIVLSVTTIDGKARVKAGDAVVKDQELITGVIRNDELGLITTAAKGTVMAEVLYTYTATAGPMIQAKGYTGNEVCYNQLELLGFMLEREADYETYDEEEVCEYVLQGCFLPLSIKRVIRRETDDVRIRGSAEALKKEALAKAEAKLLSLIPEGARITSKLSETRLDENGAVSATIRITTEENIAEARGIYGND